jgi:hypothetical protein
MKWEEIWERTKPVLSILEALLPWLENQVSILPVNPAIRKQYPLLSMLLAGLGGIGTYGVTKTLTTAHKVWLLSVALIACFILVLLQSALGLASEWPPTLLFLLPRAFYLLFFAAAAIAVGAILRLLS